MKALVGDGRKCANEWNSLRMSDALLYTGSEITHTEAARSPLSVYGIFLLSILLDDR
jgi:hypothetical protein